MVIQLDWSGIKTLKCGVKLRPELLLQSNIPKPMHGLAPRVIEGKDWWDTQRHIAYKKTNFCCAACGIYKLDAMYHSWLEAHEVYTIDYIKGIMKFEEIVALCHSCHSYIHNGRLQKLLESGDVSQEIYSAIITHGNKLTENLVRLPPQTTNIARWFQWRLLYAGKYYKGKFYNISDWANFYSQT